MLKNEFVKQGNWLFRWRSYLPLLILPILFLAIRETAHSEQFMGLTLDYFFKILCILVTIAGILVRFLVIGFVPKGTSVETQGSRWQILSMYPACILK